MPRRKKRKARSPKPEGACNYAGCRQLAIREDRCEKHHGLAFSFQIQKKKSLKEIIIKQLIAWKILNGDIIGKL